MVGIVLLIIVLLVAFVVVQLVFLKFFRLWLQVKLLRADVKFSKLIGMWLRRVDIRTIKMLGEVGVVITPLRPVGMCDFSGQRVECAAEGGYTDKGKKVKVIDVESTQLTVRKIEDEDS
jgi:membrane-bound ClpP family serine protease